MTRPRCPPSGTVPSQATSGQHSVAASSADSAFDTVLAGGSPRGRTSTAGRHRCGTIVGPAIAWTATAALATPPSRTPRIALSTAAPACAGM